MPVLWKRLHLPCIVLRLECFGRIDTVGPPWSAARLESTGTFLVLVPPSDWRGLHEHEVHTVHACLAFCLNYYFCLESESSFGIVTLYSAFSGESKTVNPQDSECILASSLPLPLSSLLPQDIENSHSHGSLSSHLMLLMTPTPPPGHGGWTGSVWAGVWLVVPRCVYVRDAVRWNALLCRITGGDLREDHES